MCSAPVGRSPVSIRSSRDGCRCVPRSRHCARARRGRSRSRRVTLQSAMRRPGVAQAEVLGFWPVPTIGVSIAVPEPWGSELQQYRIERGRPLRPADPHPRHPAAAVRGRGPRARPRRASTSRTSPSARRRSGSTCAAPAPSGRSRRWSSSTWSRGSATSSSSRPTCARGPLVVETAFPYHPHVTIAHDLPEAGLEQAFVELERYDASFDVDRMWLYVHNHKTGWQPARSFALGAPCP